MLKTDGHGTIRKVKGGAVGVIALSGLMLSMNAVSADTQLMRQRMYPWKLLRKKGLQRKSLKY